METTCNTVAADFEQQACALLYIDAFHKICAKARGDFRVVPLKGIDLLLSLYTDTLDRELKDIDLLVVPASRAKRFIELVQAEGYRPEFSFALDEAALAKKRKVSMLSPSGLMPNIDVHLALVTKKFFSSTIGSFNEDALSRIKVVDDVVSMLDNVDRWLYLAVHLSFHFLKGEKWYRDLAMLMDRFDENETLMLIKRSKQYNLERVVCAVCIRLQSQYPDVAAHINIEELLPDKRGKHFISYIDSVATHPKRLEHGLRLARYYWEFIFISKKKQRRRSLMSLMFPSIGNMQNIYRCHAVSAVLLYLPHMLLNTLGILLFSVQYFFISTLHKK